MPPLEYSVSAARRVGSYGSAMAQLTQQGFSGVEWGHLDFIVFMLLGQTHRLSSKK